MRIFAAIALLAIAMVGTGLALYRGYDPADSDNSPRFRAAVVVMALSAHKKEVEEYVQSHGHLEGVGATLRIPPNVGGYLARATVSESGTMVGFDSRNEFVVTLAPSMQAGSVHWTCTIKPDVSSAICPEK